MQIRNVCHVLPAALLLITVGSPSVHAGFEQSRSDESVRTTHTYEDNPLQLRSFIDQQVGIDKLKVPATNADIPVPPDPAGTEKLPDGSFKTKDRYQTTEAKRFLGKMLFHDPIRTARINKNQGQPVDLPAGTAFGGTVSASNPNVQAIVNATQQTGSCGSCHFGEAASKAGQLINLHVDAEGRGYTDAKGNFITRRRTQEILTQQRSVPIFPGDTLVDGLPTLTDIDSIGGQRVVTTPANFYHESNPEALLQTGRLDELDSVGRLSMSVIGLAFNNRLLFGGFGGESPSTIGSLNPFDDPAVAYHGRHNAGLDLRVFNGFWLALCRRFRAADIFPRNGALHCRPVVRA